MRPPPRSGFVQLRHALAIREVFVEFILAARAGIAELDDFTFEEDLARVPAFKEGGLVPDGLAVLATGGKRLAVAVEVDLGTETTTTLRKKFEGYRGVMSVALAVGVSVSRVLVVCERPTRLTTMRRLLDEARVDAWVLLQAELGQRLGALLSGGSPEAADAFVPLP